MKKYKYGIHFTKEDIADACGIKRTTLHYYCRKYDKDVYTISLKDLIGFIILIRDNTNHRPKDKL